MICSVSSRFTDAVHRIKVTRNSAVNFKIPENCDRFVKHLTLFDISV